MLLYVTMAFVYGFAVFNNIFMYWALSNSSCENELDEIMLITLVCSFCFTLISTLIVLGIGYC